MTFFYFINPKNRFRGGPPRAVVALGDKKRLLDAVEKREIRTEELRDKLYQLLSEFKDREEWEVLADKILFMEEEEDAFLHLLLSDG